MNRQQVAACGILLLLTVAMTGYANAQSGFITESSGNPSGTAIPIRDYNPLLSNEANTIFSTVTITAGDVATSDNGGDIVDVFFTIEGLTHSHLSDLTVTVTHTETNRIATLFQRVGITDIGTDLGSNGIIDNQDIDGVGFSANFSGPYRFKDGGDSLFVAASNTADDAVVPTLNSEAVGSPFYAATGAGNGMVGLLSAFGRDSNGNALKLTDIVGTYRFAISDRSSVTTNSDVPPAGLQSFTRTNVAFQAGPPNNSIPEPTSASGMLLALFGLVARRRRV